LTDHKSLILNYHMKGMNKSMSTNDKILMLSLISMSSKKAWLGITKIQKLSFLMEYLLSKNNKRAFDYEFFIYDLGPMSIGVYNDFEFLLNERLVVENEYGIRPSDFGENISKEFQGLIPKEISSAMRYIVNEYASMKTDDLVEFVHKMKLKLPNGTTTCIEDLPKNFTLLRRPLTTIFKIGNDYLETFHILHDRPLTEAIQQTRKKGAKSKPYESLASS